MAEEKRCEKEFAAAVVQCYYECSITLTQSAAHYPYFSLVDWVMCDFDLQSFRAVPWYEKFSQRQQLRPTKGQGQYHNWLCVLEEQELLSSLIWADVVGNEKSISFGRDKMARGLVWLTGFNVSKLPVDALRVVCLTHQTSIIDSAEKLFRVKQWDPEIIQTCRRNIAAFIKYLDSQCAEPIFSRIFSPEVSAAQLAQTGMACMPKELLNLVAQYFVVDRREVYTRLLADKKLFHPDCFRTAR